MSRRHDQTIIRAHDVPSKEYQHVSTARNESDQGGQIFMFRGPSFQERQETLRLRFRQASPLTRRVFIPPPRQRRES